MISSLFRCKTSTSGAHICPPVSLDSGDRPPNSEVVEHPIHLVHQALHHPKRVAAPPKWSAQSGTTFLSRRGDRSVLSAISHAPSICHTWQVLGCWQSTAPTDRSISMVQDPSRFDRRRAHRGVPRNSADAVIERLSSERDVSVRDRCRSDGLQRQDWDRNWSSGYFRVKLDGSGRLMTNSTCLITVVAALMAAACAGATASQECTDGGPQRANEQWLEMLRAATSVAADSSSSMRGRDHRSVIRCIDSCTGRRGTTTRRFRFSLRRAVHPSRHLERRRGTAGHRADAGRAHRCLFPTDLYRAGPEQRACGRTARPRIVVVMVLDAMRATTSTSMPTSCPPSVACDVRARGFPKRGYHPPNRDSVGHATIGTGSDPRFMALR